MRFFFFSSRRRHTRCGRDWSSDVCSSDLLTAHLLQVRGELRGYQREITTTLAALREERAKKDPLLARVRSEKVVYERPGGELEKSAPRIEGLLRGFEARRPAAAAVRHQPAGPGLGRLNGRVTGP